MLVPRVRDVVSTGAVSYGSRSSHRATMMSDDECAIIETMTVTTVRVKIR